MKNALISPNEPVNNFDNTSGYRVAEVVLTTFEVAPTLFWVECADDVIADQFYYDPADSQIKAVPVPPVPEANNVVGDAPNVIA